jgi:alpha-mannosidase
VFVKWKGISLAFTIQKLRNCVEALSKATEGPAQMLSPVYSTAATGPMAIPSLTDTQWQPLEVGVIWGLKHGTSWLMTPLQAPESMQRLPLVLQLHWDTPENDALFLLLEATVFLDGRAIGAFDWRHPVLLLPEEAGNGQPHTLMLQVYTSVPLPFGGLTLRPRCIVSWHLYHLMQTLLETALTLNEGDLARHALLAHLNTAYNMLDLREGWQGKRFADSAQAAYDYLIKEYPAINRAPTINRDATGGGRFTADPGRPRITVSGHAHLDVAWMWPYWRTRQKIAHTVSNVLGLMERYPNYYYSQSQPQLLEWLKEDMPELYARVKQRVAEGRFEPVGAMWIEADCNLTSGESLIRQIMHGTRFWQQEFGVKPRQIWLPDVFGYSAALPQIMLGCNIPVFMTTKISWNQFNRMPCDTFRWRGIDGSEVLTHFITAPELDATTGFYSYNGPLRPSDMTGTWMNYRQQDINDHLLYLCGWGDGGGGPTEEQMERVQIMADLPDFPQVRAGRAEDYFTELYQRVWENPRLPTWVGELYLEYHRGTYTSQARIKQANRRAELFYREVELLNAWASLYGMPSRQEQLNQGWRLILLNQFHDVLPGSSIHEVYDDTERIYAEARAIGKRIYDEALAVVLQHTPAGEQDLLLLNTLAWERTDPIQVPAQLVLATDGINPHYALMNQRSTAQQTTDWEGNTVFLLDGVRVPPCGVQVIPAASNAGSGEAQIPYVPGKSTLYSVESRFIDSETIVLHNEYYDLRIDGQGEISRLYDMRAERDVLAPGQTGNQLIAYEDRPLNFDAWDIDLFYEEKPYPVRTVTSMQIIEEGPVRATVEIVRPYMSSRITQRISLWRNSPRIDIATEIDWHEHQTLLKVAFPLAINSTRASYEIQFGNVERPTHRNTSWDMARFEVCAHRWIDLSEGGYGISLLNDSKYGHDVHDNVVRLTLLKSGVYPDAHADEGLHRFTYSLLPHVGDWREAQSVRRAYELNVPVVCAAGQKKVTSMPGVPTKGIPHDKSGVYTFIQTECTHVIVETVKPAEDGDGLVVRLYEAHNQRGGGTLTFATAILSAQECNLLEEPINDVSYQGNTLPFQVRPFEIKTFRIRLAPER